MTPNIKAAIASISDDAWTTITYTDAILDEDTGELISSAEVAEVPFTAFASGKKTDRIPGRLAGARAGWLLDGLWRQLGVDSALRQVVGGRRFSTDVERLLLARWSPTALVLAWDSPQYVVACRITRCRTGTRLGTARARG